MPNTARVLGIWLIVCAATQAHRQRLGDLFFQEGVEYRDGHEPALAHAAFARSARVIANAPATEALLALQDQAFRLRIESIRVGDHVAQSGHTPQLAKPFGSFLALVGAGALIVALYQLAMHQLANTMNVRARNLAIIGALLFLLGLILA